MNIAEIVGAIVNSDWITTDSRAIDHSLAKHEDVEYISRNRARIRAAEGQSQLWQRLANAPTLFLVDHGVRFRPAIG